jgi:DNA polymerase III gamma/tau subunit
MVKGETERKEIMELYRKYRPKTFDEVEGQREAVGTLKGWLAKKSVPHSIMFEGASGCGKTTLARILASELGCKNDLNYQEMNVAIERGVAMVESLLLDCKNNFTGGNRVWVLDEIQAVSKPAMQSLLKVLEESPPYAYFFLCTTDPAKILPTLMNRCQHIKVNQLSDTALENTIKRVAEGENREVPKEVMDAIVHYSEGSARKAVVKLEQCLAATKPENMLALITQETGLTVGVKQLCTIFTSGKKYTWKDTARILDHLQEDSETIRRAILGWVSSAMVRGWGGITPQALAEILRIFQFNTYDSGKPQLVLMVYDAWKILNK